MSGGFSLFGRGPKHWWEVPFYAIYAIVVIPCLLIWAGICEAVDAYRAWREKREC